MDIFSNCNYQKSNKEPVKNKNVETNALETTNFQAKILERQMNDWLRQKHGMNYDPVSLNKHKNIEVYENNTTNTDASNNAASNNAASNFVDREIINKFRNKKWTSLPKSLKWNLIKIYCEKNELDNKNYKKNLEKNIEMNVIYDHKNGEITSIDLIG